MYSILSLNCVSFGILDSILSFVLNFVLNSVLSGLLYCRGLAHREVYEEIFRLVKFGSDADVPADDYR